MFITAVCVIFLIKLRWPKTKSLYNVISFAAKMVVKWPTIVKAAFTGKLAAYSNTLVQLLSFLFQLVVTFTSAVTSAIAATTTSSTSSSVTTAYNFNRLLLLLYFSRFFYGVNHLIRQITVKLSIP